MRLCSVKTMARSSYLCQLLLVIMVAGCTGCNAETRVCHADFPVFDPEGNRLAFDIVLVRPEDYEGINLLRPNEFGNPYESRGSRLYFGKELVPSRTLVVELENDDRLRVSTSFAPFDCQQRVSLRFGNSDSGRDVSATLIRGRLSGCDIKGDWWIRAAPMFGKYGNPVSDHSSVSAEDGSFWVVAKGGVRHIVSIGKGRSVVRSVEADVTEGTRNDVGVIDLSQYCPD
jgi:hypothetical protein